MTQKLVIQQINAKMVGLAKDAQDLAYPGYPGLTMTMLRRIIPFYVY